MKKNKAICLILSVMMTMTLFAGCGQKKTEEAVVPLTPVETYSVSKGDIKATYAAVGQVKPVLEVDVIPKLSGKVERVSKEIGDRVEAGEMLFTLEKQDLHQSLEQLDAQLRQSLLQAETALQQAEMQMNNAKADYTNNQVLFEGQAISKQTLDSYKRIYEAAEVQYKSALDNYLLLQNKAGKSTIETQKEAVVQKVQDSNVKAPISGIIAQKNIEAGEMATQQDAAYTIVDMDTVVIETTVTERIINEIHKGQEVLVTIAALEGKNFQGMIDALSPAVTGKSVGYPVKITIPNDKHEIKPGMFAEVHITTDTKDNVIMIPIEAVLSQVGKSSIFVLEGDIAKKREVQLGLKDDNYYEVAEGLNEGEQVIIKGQQFVIDGEKVLPVGGTK
ncbi:efflux RND transporter periplasmic adaptor subunit [Petroclostridium sp. X23]|uniref:efflux RND transporter periplasmic adaptor subunit n=1 Tax=Petroclostridium sp. X23 TaxID=3045146 RepID=UPI0024ACF634|nr:efflux RND transporter periplasmic adaptor subunit [Petroclostridium sp. X23]WHH57356.1 efflux RND transporter periplasmic adaptor subunit [Petroclostridium sp. X23]